MKMKAMSFFSILLLGLMVCSLVTAEEEEKKDGVVMPGKPDNQSFLEACDRGFARDYTQSAEAMRFGNGSFQILVSDKDLPKPINNGSCPLNGNTCQIPKRKLEDLVAECSKNTAQQKRQATYFAWRDDRGVFNIVTNARIEKSERTIIWQLGDENCRKHLQECDWSAWNIYYVADTVGNFWIRTQDEPHFTWLKLGHVKKDAKELCKKLKVLADLHIVEL